MMLINKRDEIYFFDRNNTCFQVENITFVKAGNLGQHLEDTLLDGVSYQIKFLLSNKPNNFITLGNGN